MDGTARITLTWGDGEHTFRLPLKQLRELQDKTGCGPEFLYRKIADGNWSADDLRDIIRLGLIGAGMDEVKAAKLMKQYYDDGPFLKHKPAATAVLLAALLGPPDDTPQTSPGKEGRRSQNEKTGASPSPDLSEAPALSE